MRVQGDHWVDEEGRRLILRGANLGGDCKVPVMPDGDTKNKAGFYDRKGVSFVGRPFPLAEADEHFTRLSRWGLTFLRFLTTWEAVEHDGPGLYDEAYLDYLEAVVAKAGEHGISLFIDPHQDVWSRWTGGDGAPIWALEAAGFCPERLNASGAAILNQELGDAYPRMIWTSNHDRLACATMGIALLISFNNEPLLLSGTAFIIIITWVIRRLPYTIRSSAAMLQQTSPSVEEAAISLGASDLKAFAKVTLPSMLPGVLSGAIMSWMSVITELSASILLYTGLTKTLTISIYTEVIRANYGNAAALSSILTLTTVVTLLLFFKITGKREIEM